MCFDKRQYPSTVLCWLPNQILSESLLKLSVWFEKYDSVYDTLRVINKYYTFYCIQIWLQKMMGLNEWQRARKLL